MRLLKAVTVRLALDMQPCFVREAGEGFPVYEFVSTGVRDFDGHVHGMVVDPSEWARLHAYSCVDEVRFVGDLLLPEASDFGYEDVVVTRRLTGETYVSGEVVGARFLSTVTSPFFAEKIPATDAIPVFDTISTPCSVLDYTSDRMKESFADLLSTYPGGYKGYCIERSLMNRRLVKINGRRTEDTFDVWLNDLRNEENMVEAELRWQDAIDQEGERSRLY